VKQFLPALFLLFAALPGCSMFPAWKSIPPPGGCDQCHTAELSGNWSVAYQAASVADERGQLAFQTPQYNTPVRRNQIPSALDLRKVEDSRCFDCHNAPTPAHKERSGKYHHGQ
jgi:hypothetical protein